MKKLRNESYLEMLGPLGFLAGWIGFCAFLLGKYAGYILGPIS